MKKGFWDYVTDELKNSIGFVRNEVRSDFKNVKPFREVKLNNEQKIINYLSMPDDMRTQMLQDFGEPFMKYETDMQDKIRRYTNAGRRI